MINNELTLCFAQPDDFNEWLNHWNGYQEFYEVDIPSEITEQTWQRFFNDDIPSYCVVAKKGNTIVGFTHFIYHCSTWSPTSYCYLEDLFVDPQYRGQHIGKALIEFVIEEAKKHHCTKVYWHTQESNHTAQRLYDWVAKKPGMIKYDLKL